MGAGGCSTISSWKRLWRSVKYEEVYLKDYQDVPEARSGLARYFEFYNHQRPHQALAYRTPQNVYLAESGKRNKNAAGKKRKTEFLRRGRPYENARESPMRRSTGGNGQCKSRSQ